MKRMLAVMVFWMFAVSASLAAVNVNTATKEQLDSLKGIGPAKAQAIIDYRAKHGPFKSVDDLQKVPGIGPATLKEIRGEVSVSGATSLPATEPKKESAKADAKGGDGKGTAKVEPGKGAGKSEEKAASKASESKAPSRTEEKKAVPKADEKKSASRSDDAKTASRDDARKPAEKEARKDARAVGDERK